MRTEYQSRKDLVVSWRKTRFFPSMQPGGWSGLALISPTFAYSLLMLAAPLLLVFLLSLWTQNYLELDRTFTMANYKEAASEKLYQVLMIRSVVISLIVTIFTVLLA